jgi:FkbM family methyltransferase
MKQVAGIYLPDGEADMPQYLMASGGVYQNAQLNRSLEFVSHWDLAIDIGAHVGLWSKILVQKFKRVVAFEPMAQMRACLEKNIVSDRLQVVPIALGNRHGAVSLAYDETHTGSTHIDLQTPGIVPLGKLDDFQFQNVGYMKLDCEGFEEDALAGAKETLVSSKPIIIVEEKLHGMRHYGKKPYAAIEFLESLGAELLDRVGDDLILGWPSVAGKVAPAKPTPPEHHLGMAQALQKKGDVAGAKLLFKKLVAQHPRVPEVANLLALCELQLGEHEAAVEHAARACPLNMKEARYKNTLGTCLWLVGRSSEAIAAVEAALIDNPQLAEAKENLSQMMSHRIRMEATAATYAEALEIHPDSPQLLLKLAEIHALHGSIAQAKTLYTRALSIEPNNVAAIAGLKRVESCEAA